VQSIGEHDEQKILDVELVVFEISNIKFQLQTSLENSDFHTGIKDF
jgi:hypothetical protein